MSFDIASVLRSTSVSESDTGKEQLVYLDIDLLDPDPDNFYSLEGLNDLAANIELIGLQQPLRVRPGSDGHFTIVSGHRRRAAILLIRDGDPEAFRDGVPCIVEYGEASAAMRELRLIYANSATREMTAADKSKQAERVEMLLYQLQEEGVTFPGRMRDHVAEACQVSRSKIARLHAIRKNLAPELLPEFDANALPESVAYALSQQAKETQLWIADQNRKTHNGKLSLQEWRVKEMADDVKKVNALDCRKIAGGGACIHRQEHISHMYRKGYRDYDPCISYHGEALCCANCEKLASCSDSCSRCETLKARKKADLAAQRKSERETAKADKLAAEEQHELDVSEAAIHWARLGGLLQDAGMSFDQLETELKKIPGTKTCGGHVLYTWKLQSSEAEKLLAAQPAKNDGAIIPTPFCFNDDIPAVRMLCRMADLLDVSIDYLLRRTDQRNPAAAEPQWSTGTPEARGMYETRIGLGDEDSPKTAQWQRLEWIDGAWNYPSTHAPLPKGVKVFRWIKLPEV